VSRSTQTFQILHDVGGAAWFGGSLMGLVGVNGAADAVHQSDERARVSSVGWARWSPLQVGAIGAHLLGGLGLLLANRDRAAGQPGVRGNTVVKTVLTLMAALATLYSGILGGRVGRAGDVPAESSVEPSAQTPPDVADAQKQLRVLQFAIPALTGSVVALGAQQSQLQRPEHQARGTLAAARGR
jgi:hypothetical protein